MQKKLNDIEKTWTRIKVGLMCADFIESHQNLRKIIAQLKMLKADVKSVIPPPRNGW